MSRQNGRRRTGAERQTTSPSFRHDSFPVLLHHRPRFASRHSSRPDTIRFRTTGICTSRGFRITRSGTVSTLSPARVLSGCASLWRAPRDLVRTKPPAFHVASGRSSARCNCSDRTDGEIPSSARPGIWRAPAAGDPSAPAASTPLLAVSQQCRQLYRRDCRPHYSDRGTPIARRAPETS